MASMPEVKGELDKHAAGDAVDKETAVRQHCDPTLVIDRRFPLAPDFSVSA